MSTILVLVECLHGLCDANEDLLSEIAIDIFVVVALVVIAAVMLPMISDNRLNRKTSLSEDAEPT